jgi:hypothetical protein
MRRNILAILGLSVLLLLLDQLYRVLHPEVNLVRASLVGATGFASLALARRAGAHGVDPVLGGLAIFASAFLSVLAIEAGWLVSRSLTSGAVHVAILSAAFLAADALRGRPAQSRCQRSRTTSFGSPVDSDSSPS